MFRRALITAAIGLATLAATGCHNKKVSNPIANIDSKQPDKVLYDRAMDAMKHNKFDVARVTLQTLINTYPDSEFIARAKLSIGDSWYAEGGSAAMTQAENEYRDFIVFFGQSMPNESAEAQMKIAGIHYDEMEKPDRDYTHAKRAEEEYRQMILQFPDSPLVPKAKTRLLQVQEILAQREFLIGKFYIMREDYPAAVARLQTLSDTYPLFSGSDEALFLLGEAHQAEANLVRKASRLAETQRANAIAGFEKDAVAAYSKIITRYPATDRVEAAKKKLAELHAPIPTPTPEAIAQSKAEEAGRGHLTKKSEMMSFMKHHPDTSMATNHGDPIMVDPPQTSAVDLVHNANATLIGKPAPTKGGSGITLETPTGTGPAPENQPIPRSDSGATAPTTAAPVETGTPTPTAPSTSGGASSTTLSAAPASTATAAPTSAPATNTAAAPAPTRVNDANTDSSNATTQSTTSSTAAPAAQDSSQTPQDSSSKKKKKHGIGKLNPF
ncbi:DNA uptake lipoprotein-like protein [Candidatus Koribacter versatilis Ellin345]|uniref:DNA uptake lipoprotein-like protein n=1 Tax=Koribacter versatilis (strain Ellin345) TaxID=204669 RepID=Q1IVM2_KORVE|nr:outer membrane protein assembly factor BamD [Candidatus Koribacter versatilis]ABF39078.1 DNA uptake lipoprotein-like protein [Candidatus Koribacter versatilis Ellin345]